MIQFVIFLFSVVIVSLSGVISPGPLTFITIVKSYKNKNAGILVSLGHGIVELPLIFLLYFGFTQVFHSAIFKSVVGVLGGCVLIFLGLNMLVKRKFYLNGIYDLPYPTTIAGMVTTVSNPYFFIWWGTIGLSLVITASKFGFAGVVTFALVHLLCDFLWYIFLSNLVFKSKNIFSEKVFNIVLFVCGFLLIIFGITFVVYFI